MIESEADLDYQLCDKIVAEFSDTPKPRVDELMPHRCDECDAIRDKFRNVEWSSAGHDLLANNVDALSLFSAQAFHYYLPAYLLDALNRFYAYDIVLEFVLNCLSPSPKVDNGEFTNERKSKFSAKQQAVIVDFIKLILNTPGMESRHEDANQALKFWLGAGKRGRLEDAI
jgi:hypothetical protein